MASMSVAAYTVLLFLQCHVVALIAAEPEPEAEAGPPEYLQTLPTATQKAVAHCHNITHDADARLLCNLIHGLNSQASDAHVNTTSSPECAFKREGGDRLHRYATPPSPHFEAALAAYIAMHRRCAAAESHAHVAAIHRNSNKRSSSNNNKNNNNIKCRYVVAGGVSGGLGNRMLGMASTFIYALVSQRVLLISYPDWHRLFCEPFPGALVDADAPFYGGVGVPALQFLTTTMPALPSVVSMGLHHGSSDAELRALTCPATFRRMEDVGIVEVRGSNQFFATGMFQNPALAPLLHLLFPERNPFHAVSKFLYAPSDPMWRRIGAKAEQLRSGAVRGIGVQIREFWNYTPAYDDNVLRCILRHSALCPREHGQVSVYVATIVRHHVHELQERRQKMEAALGRHVRVVTQRLADEDEDGVERHGIEQQQEALLDMWMLSLSDVLLTSFESTFGYVSHALGGLVPFYINRHSVSDGDDEKVCSSGFSSEPCYHFPPKAWSCPNQRNNATARPRLDYVRPCPDRSSGWQLTQP